MESSKAKANACKIKILDRIAKTRGQKSRKSVKRNPFITILVIEVQKLHKKADIKMYGFVEEMEGYVKELSIVKSKINVI